MHVYVCVYVYMSLCTNIHKSFQSWLGITQVIQLFKGCNTYKVVRLCQEQTHPIIFEKSCGIVSHFWPNFPRKKGGAAVSKQDFPHFISNLSINRLAKSEREFFLCCIEAGIGSMENCPVMSLQSTGCTQGNIPTLPSGHFLYALAHKPHSLGKTAG